MLISILFYLYHLQRDLKNDITGLYKEMGNLRDRASRIEGLLEGLFSNHPVDPGPSDTN